MAGSSRIAEMASERFQDAGNGYVIVWGNGHNTTVAGTEMGGQEGSWLAKISSDGSLEWHLNTTVEYDETGSGAHGHSYPSSSTELNGLEASRGQDLRHDSVRLQDQHREPHTHLRGHGARIRRGRHGWEPQIPLLRPLMGS